MFINTWLILPWYLFNILLIAPYVSLIRLVWSLNILSNTEIIYLDCIIAYPESSRFFFLDFITHMILQTVNINISDGCNVWTNKHINFTNKSASMVEKRCEYHFVQCFPIYERTLPCEFSWSSVLRSWVWSIGGMILIGENVPEVSLFQCHFIRQKSQVDWPGIDPGHPR